MLPPTVDVSHHVSAQAIAELLDLDSATTSNWTNRGEPARRLPSIKVGNHRLYDRAMPSWLGSVKTALRDPSLFWVFAVLIASPSLTPRKRTELGKAMRSR
jgi:hypothetical protein